MNDTVHNLVAAIKTGDAITTEQAFAAAMAEKLAGKIEDLRMVTAQNMFNQVTEAKHDDEEDKEENKDEDKEDKDSEEDKDEETK